MSISIKFNDLVWAKMKKFPPWPSRVTKPPRTRKGYHWVYFFGTHNFGWVQDTHIKPYDEFKQQFVSGSTLASFKKAVEEIEVHKKSGDNVGTEEDNESFASEDTQSSTDSPSPKKTKKTPVKRQSADRKDSPVSAKHTKKTREISETSINEENGVLSHSVGTELLNLPSVLDPPDSPTLDLSDLKDNFRNKDISPANFTYGFLGLGIMGRGIVRSLIASGHRVNLYSRNRENSEEFKAEADKVRPGLVQTYLTPCDVMLNSDIVFSCVSDPRAAKTNITGTWGIVGSNVEGDALENKGYVEMTGIDPQTSKDICEIIKSKGGRYLEAQIQGSKTEAEDGTLLILTAGDKSLFLDCQTCFKAMGKMSFFLGDVGYASKVYLILQMMKGVSLVALAEGIALADRCGISSKDILHIFNMTTLACPYLVNKAELIANKDFKRVEHSVQNMQKDFKLTLDLADQLKLPLMMASTGNEIYKHSRRLGYDEHDAACIYMKARY